MIETRSIHEQLLEQCQRDLASGRLRTGERFPSERELAGQHGISRATANKVLARLVSEGWLTHRRGIGCFVAERPTLFASLRHLESFTAFAENLGLRPETTVRELKKLGRSEEPFRELLAVGEEVPLWYLERLRCLDGEPVIFERRWLPGDLFPRLSRTALSGSFYALCRDRFGLNIGGEDLRIRVAAAGDPVSADWPGGAFVFSGSGATAGGRPVWVQEIFYRAERFELHSTTLPNQPYPEFGLVFRGHHLQKEIP